MPSFRISELIFEKWYKPIFDLEMSNFVQDQGKPRIARRRTEQYAAQVILPLDADIGQKGHF
jgi:hypothetical protein